MFFCSDGSDKSKAASEENKISNEKLNGNNINIVEKKLDEIQELT